MHRGRYGVAFLEGDTAEMERQSGNGGGRQAGLGGHALYRQASDAEGYYGRLTKAQWSSRRRRSRRRNATIAKKAQRCGK